ncbi:ABC transporter permease [Planomonospora sp. ID82291]|uniref:ABC transporter permease n=1 Tax=Planomonospora sp. ID82291 TaxID=2738136 RepID=UPI0018C3D258|nr:ABC transporter permease [Planomonospora sp. ID82291]MBG0817904.1 ABC transporter permease [Planomonospora sp. ID82291]
MSVRLVARLARHETLSFLRTPVTAFFTVAMPLLMTVIVGAAVGGGTVDPGSGVRVMQFVVPVMTVFGIAQGCFGALAIHLADLRDRGWLKRMRGTPVPAWALMAGLAGASLAIAAATVVVLLGAGLVFYDVHLVWHTVPALLVTLALGALCFTALGFAVVALVRNAAAVQLIGTGLLLALAFISDVILVGARMPAWLETVGWVFPLRHFAEAVRDDFNPFLSGAGFHADHLAVLAAWGLGAGAVAVRRFRWERPQTRAAGTAGAVRTAGAAGAVRTAGAAGAAPGRPARPAGRPRAWRLIGDQTAHATLRLRRDLSTAFFTAVLPVLLLVLISLVFGEAQVEGVRLPLFMLAAMTAYTVGVSAYVNLAEAVAGDRERGVAKRLAGTPLPDWAYYAGWIACALWVTLATAVVLALVAAFGYDVRIGLPAVPAALVTVLLGVACFAVLGTLVATLAPRAATANAITLGTFLPLAFVSDVFVVGGPLPGVLETAGDVFPLKHLSHALVAALDPAGRPWPWADLAVVAAWTLAGVLAVAVASGRRGRGGLPG